MKIPEPKSTSETKKNLHNGFNSQLVIAEERVGELEDKSTESIIL